MTEILQKKFNYAVEFEKKGDYSSALKEYKSIIEQDKNFRDAYLNLGSLYSRMKQYDNAMSCYREALILGEDYLIYFNVGSIHYLKHSYKMAIINMEKSRNINEDFSLPTLVMGLCYSRLNNIKAAVTNFINVLKINSSNKVALTALAIIYYNHEKYSESLLLLNRLIEVDGDNITLRKLKYSILEKTNQLSESSIEIKRIKKISNGYKLYDDFIKSVPISSYTDRYGTLDEKIKSLEESQKKNQKDKDLLVSLSLCHLFKGNSDLAIDYLFEAKKKMAN